MLDERKEKILAAIVTDFIDTAEPVGSRTISKKYDIGFSSATIRNEMSDLEEMGYIVQPHTSAGRIPTDVGYRYYVDRLMFRAQRSYSDEKQLYRLHPQPGQPRRRAHARHPQTHGRRHRLHSDARGAGGGDHKNRCSRCSI